MATSRSARSRARSRVASIGRIVAAIPVRNALIWTQSLVTTLLDHDEADELWLFDNGSTDGTAEWLAALADSDQRLVVSHRPNARLYAMWNEMVFRASQDENTSLAILNNDIRLPPLGLRTMQQAMRGFDLAFIDRNHDVEASPIEPRIVPADWPQRTGWAFMMRAAYWRNQPYAVDPGLRIWWGDDDLARRAQMRGGRLCIVEGIGCFHAESQTAYPNDKLADIEHDRDYYRRIWDRN